MSKERLEEIKIKTNNTTEPMLYVPYSDINWLIEQAEREQELENEVLVYKLENRTLGKECEELRKREQELEKLVVAYQTELSIKDNANKRIKKQNKRYREAIDYVMTAKTTHYNSLENALEDIKFVINETLEGEE